MNDTRRPRSFAALWWVILVGVVELTIKYGEFFKLDPRLKFFQWDLLLGCGVLAITIQASTKILMPLIRALILRDIRWSRRQWIALALPGILILAFAH